MHYLLTFDLHGWVPPSRAPLTQEKAASYVDSLTPVEEFAYACRSTEGGGLTVIRQALDANKAWAETMAEIKGRHADIATEMLRAWNSIQLRPWYTAKEIALMFPMISAALYGNRRIEHTPSGAISKQLRNAGIFYLRNSDDPHGFLAHGRREQYLVLAEFDKWREPVSQAEFDRLIQAFPRYSDAGASKKGGGS